MKKMRDLIVGNCVIWAMAVAIMLVGCTSDTELDYDSTTTTTGTAAQWIDGNLENYYLYSTEYKSMERDTTLSYSAFLNNTLMSMTTNVLDKKYYTTVNSIPYYGYKLYSYVYCELSTKSRATMDSREGTGYGFVSTELVRYNGELAIAIHGVYKDSPADVAGMGRGTIITEIEGEQITWSGYYGDLEYELLYPSYGDQMTITTDVSKAQTIEATTIETNPILHSEIIDSSIGYLVYSKFDDNFDSDLTEVLQEFATAGVTDLILDLRVNPGGYVSTARLMGSIIGGTYASGEVFMYYRFNDDMTSNYTSTSSIMSLTYDSSNEAFFSYFSTTSVQLNSLSPRIYCLVSEDTASASELLINSLRGVDFEVILIGSQTEGKNVGMVELSTTIDGYDYYLLPITFENLNAKMEGEYSAGMEVDYEVDDLLDYQGFNDYGTDDPLVTKAMELITGVTQQQTRSTCSASQVARVGRSAVRHKVSGAIHPIGE